ncbi:hypothetical protein D3C87_2071570 [compost metagenome]
MATSGPLPAKVAGNSVPILTSFRFTLMPVFGVKDSSIIALIVLAWSRPLPIHTVIDFASSLFSETFPIWL